MWNGKPEVGERGLTDKCLVAEPWLLGHPNGAIGGHFHMAPPLVVSKFEVGCSESWALSGSWDMEHQLAGRETV